MAIRNLLSLLFSLVTTLNTVSIAQILRKEIYTFEVGDYYNVQYKSGNPSTTLKYDRLYHILTRNYNVDSSEVSYTAERQSFKTAFGPTQPATFTIDTINFSHLSLLDTFSALNNEKTFGDDWLNTLFYYPDTTNCYNHYYGFTYPPCSGLNLWTLTYGMFPTTTHWCAIEPLISNYYVKQGCGGPYGIRQQPGDPTSSSAERQLVYFKKNGVECGGILNQYFVGVNELPQNKINVYPQPADNKVYIISDLPVYSVELIDFKGEYIKKLTKLIDNQINIENLPSGIYFLNIELMNGDSQLKRIVKL